MLTPGDRACGPALFCALKSTQPIPPNLVRNPGILCIEAFEKVPDFLCLALKTYDLPRIAQGTCSAPRCPNWGGRAQPHIPASAAPVSWRIRATPRRSASQDFAVPSVVSNGLANPRTKIAEVRDAARFSKSF